MQADIVIIDGESSGIIVVDRRCRNYSLADVPAL
jgi:hypothetical protein